MIADEGRAVDRREHRALAANGHVARGIAGMLDIFPRRALLDDRARQPAREMNAGAPHVGAGLLPQLQALVVAMELDADLLENDVGIVLDDLQPLLAQHLDHGVRRLMNGSCSILGRPRAARRASAPPRARRPAAGTSGGVWRWVSLTASLTDLIKGNSPIMEAAASAN